MRKLFILPALLIVFSCKKNCVDKAQLNETHWNLYFKNNNTFNFYAEAELYFKEDKSAINYRNFDTIYGDWITKENTVTINFKSGEKYTGNIITNDSISGTLTTAGNSGIWYATKK